MLLALIIRKKSQTISNNLTKAHIRSFDKHDSISTNFHIITIYLALSCTGFGWPECLDVSCMPKWPQSKEKPTAIFTIFPFLEEVKWIFMFSLFHDHLPSFADFVFVGQSCLHHLHLKERSAIQQKNTNRQASRAAQ